MKILKKISQALQRLLNRRQFTREFLSSLPEAYRPAARIAYYRQLDMSDEERALGKKIESYRNKLSKQEQGTIRSFDSPHSSTFKKMEGSDHAEPGAIVESSVEATLEIGSNVAKGTLIRRVAEGAKATRVLELGTNTGFSGCYYLSIPGVQLVTIEGSKELCDIAQDNLARISSNFTIMNCLFDEAIDELIAKGDVFDCVFIDGQHEKEATLHYAKRVQPLMTENACFIFDDIYWSEDMNQAWKTLNKTFGFSEAIDLFTLGIGLTKPNPSETQLFDLGQVIPRPATANRDW